MAFDFSRLRGRIVEKFGTCGKFAEAMGKTKGWLSNRLSGLVSWDASEIHAACAPEMLDIAPEEIPAYFFTPKFH